MPAAEDPLPKLECWVSSPPGGEGGRRLIVVEVTAPESADVARPPVDIVLALDRSSSMVGPRIAAAVEAARQICMRLQEGDRLGVVAFDGTARIVRKPGPAGPEIANELAVSLAELGVGYGTNIAEGWAQSAELIARGGVPQASRTVLLLTDGLPSRGPRSSSELINLAKRGVDQGIVTTTVGIGDRFDEELLAKLAKAGGGAFRFAQTSDETIAVADEEVEGLVRLGADELILHFGFAPAVTRYEVLQDLSCRPEADGTAVEMGRLFAGRPRAVVVEATVAGEGQHLGAVALTCVSPAGASVAMDPIRIMAPAPGQHNDDAKRVGRHYVPLRVATWQREIWECGRDADLGKLRIVIDRAKADLGTIPEALTASDDARDALDGFDAVCHRIEEILADQSADENDRKMRTSLTLKGIAEERSRTLSGTSTSMGLARRRRRGWGKDR